MPAERRVGSLYAIAAFGFWGLTPVYYKLMPHVPPVEVLAHRVVWSVVFGALFVSLVSAWPAVRSALANPRTLRALALTAALVSTNWLIYIYAVVSDQVMATSLGYYINPLVNVLLGMLFLGERLGRGRTLAVALAALGTASLAFELGGLPWISLTLAFSFGFYGLIRKRLGLPAMAALFVETLLVAPLALLALGWFGVQGESAFGSDLRTTVLLIFAGPVTLLPLLWFAEAARRLPLITVGFFQYLAPTLTFLLATLVYSEPFTLAWAVTFVLIWSGLAVFTIDSIRTRQILRQKGREGGAS
ncbi:MAG TPA: EamA family transporter RarD [Gammaproteobacteria bacterium]|nr:EamA family transporter RarD [Chiayiivirga sp.]HRP34699.1 EamA family transporter RarD [Gammaproteobacteria bacterium]